MKNVSESLAGRVGILEMSSLSFAEKEGFHSRPFDPKKLTPLKPYSSHDIFRHIFLGGMPEYVADKLDRKMFFDDYVSTYLDRDVRQLAKRWLSVLEASDLIYLLRPYSNNLLTRTTEAPKIVFLDTGLCSYLCGWNSAESLENSPVSDHYLETFVISELIKNKRNNLIGDDYDIFFYRDKDQNEIDLIIKVEDMLYPFEIKKTAKPASSMIDNFRLLEGKNIKVGAGGLICFYPEVLMLNEKYKSYPISVIF